MKVLFDVVRGAFAALLPIWTACAIGAVAWTVRYSGRARERAAEGVGPYKRRNHEG